MQPKFIISKQWFISSKENDINEDYLMMNEIGSGAYGKVFAAQEKSTLTMRAIKVIMKTRVEDYQTFINEISILKKLDHPNIVNIIETYENERVCFIVLEYCRGGELFDRIINLKRFSEAHAAEIMKQLISAVMYCHEHDICHRDLKPENCLCLNEDLSSDIKVIDFGLAAVAKEEELLHDIIGSAYYLAPEVLSNSYTKVVDCWSLGAILYLMLSGFPPFKGKDNTEILMNVYNGSFSFRNKIFKNISVEAKDLITRFLTKNPEFRITAKQAYQHPWIQGTFTSPYSELPISILDSIKSFMNSNSIKKTTLMFVVSKLTDSNISAMRMHFKMADSDGNGVLSKSELLRAMKNSANVDENNLDGIISSLDVNDNGVIDYSEFLTCCMLRKSFSTTGYLESAFKYFDKDGNGLITANEVRNVLFGGEIAQTLPINEIENMIRESDKNDDGCIDYKEFIEIIAKKES